MSTSVMLVHARDATRFFRITSAAAGWLLVASLAQAASDSDTPGSTYADPMQARILPKAPSANALRLLDQASFGPTATAIASVQAMGDAKWVDAQLAKPATGYAAIAYIDANSSVGCPTGAVATCYRDNYTPFPVQIQFPATQSSARTSCASASPSPIRRSS